MYKLMILEEKQFHEWDRFVESHKLGWLCSLSDWKKIIEKTFRHIKGKVIVLSDEKGNIVAGLPIFSVNSWLTGNRLVNIPFATIGDPLVDDYSQFSQIETELLKNRKRENAKKIEIRSLYTTGIINSKYFMPENSFKHHFIDLNEDLDKIKKGFHRASIRKSINKAIRNNLTADHIKDKNELCLFYDLFRMNRKRLGLPTFPFKLFQNMWEVLYPKGMLKVIIAKKKDTPIAAILLLCFKKRVSAECLGWDISFTQFNPSVFIYWEAIKYAHSSGFKIFDFGRTSISNIGLMTFKRKWNTKELDMPIFYYPSTVLNSNKPRESSLQYRTIKILLRYSPLFVSRLIDTFVYKHLG